MLAHSEGLFFSNGQRKRYRKPPNICPQKIYYLEGAEECQQCRSTELKQKRNRQISKFQIILGLCLFFPFLWSLIDRPHFNFLRQFSDNCGARQSVHPIYVILFSQYLCVMQKGAGGQTLFHLVQTVASIEIFDNNKQLQFSVNGFRDLILYYYCYCFMIYYITTSILQKNIC